MNMDKAKVRGIKRKLSNLLNAIEDISPLFDYSCGIEHFHVPCGEWLVRKNLNNRIKNEFINVWLRKTKEIINSKPQNDKFCRVVGIICYPELQESQIIIFYDETYYNNFFERNDEYQVWTIINNKSLIDDKNINSDLKEVGYLEELKEDDYKYKGEIWFYGEI